MNIERYEYTVNESCLEFEFVSDGPNNKIRKFISFVPQNSEGITYFNLGFGDLKEGTNFVDDLAVSDNKDKDKILATVAAAVMEFTEHFPDMFVYAKGSTPARTRLYQMGLSAHWQEIEQVLFVYGLKNNEWEPFRKNVNYEAFLAKRK